MLRENQYILRQINMALDLLTAAAAFGLAHVIRSLLMMYIAPQWVQPAHFSQYGWMMLVWPPVLVAALAFNGLYQTQRLRTRSRDLARPIAAGCLEALLVLVAIMFMASPVRQTSRVLVMILGPVSFVLLLLKTGAVRHFMMAVRQRGYNYRSVILVGSGKPLHHFIGLLTQHPIWGLKIEGIITDRADYQNQAFDAQRATHAEGVENASVLADLSRAPQLLWRTAVDEVIFVPEEAPLARLRPLMEICEQMGVRTHLPLNFYQGKIVRPLIDRFDEIPVLSYWPTRVIGPALLFKYIFDRVAALGLLTLFSPLLLGAALAVKLTSPRGASIFFGQTRCGLNGRLFTCWKLRTMVENAEALRAELDAQNEQSGPVFKIKDDPRVTPVGRWMRKFSIDELPQLWNVLRGDMSLVGPRPPLPREVEQYDVWQRRRLSMKPGITCLWQVSGRNKLSFDTWMKLDLEYIDHWSLMLDLKILLRTIYVVVTGYGAM